MIDNFRIGVVLLMAGKGVRFGGEAPKQFQNLAGKKVFLHTLKTFFDTSWIDEIVLVCHPDWLLSVAEETGSQVRVIPGGATRQESSYLGLQGFQNSPDIVMIHDAVRPFVSQEILENNVRGAIAWGAANTCIPSPDTLVHVPGGEKIREIPPREEFLRGQTPQTFRYSLIKTAHEKAVEDGIFNASDDCRLVLRLGAQVGVVKGDEQNLKITTELDLFLAEQLLRLRRKTHEEGKASLAGRKFAVLGGFGGIGSAVCELLEKEGAEAVRLSRKTGVDLRKPETVIQAFEQLGPIDGLINSAGALRVKPLELHTVEEIEELMQINFTGLVIACQKAKIKAGGHIINLASSAYTRGRKNYGIYSAAKAAVINFTQALAEEKPHLRIHAVIPQRTKTSLRANNFPGETSDLLLEPNEIAKTIIGLLKDPVRTGLLVEVKKMKSDRTLSSLSI